VPRETGALGFGLDRKKKLDRRLETGPETKKKTVGYESTIKEIPGPIVFINLYIHFETSLQRSFAVFNFIKSILQVTISSSIIKITKEKE